MSQQLPIVLRAKQYGNKTAIIDSNSAYTYHQLLSHSGQLAVALLNGSTDLCEARIAFLCPSNYSYVATQWAIWQGGGVAVPLCPTHPLAEIQYIITDCQAQMVVAHRQFEALLAPIAAQYPIFWIDDLLLTSLAITTSILLPNITLNRRAMMLYTSGTTGKPKGVVLTHHNLIAQISCLISAWEWQDTDVIPHFLPLHHTHGIVNKLCCALWAGATCYMLPRFDALEVWNALQNIPFTLFMAVPTIYSKLIAEWQKAPADQQQQWSAACRRLRLMVSGSAALPISVLEQWQQISGHVLLERYGMTEIGMALSNPYKGKRVAGLVGKPLQGVSVQVMDDAGKPIEALDAPGELWVKGDNVFLEYWNRPTETEKAFTNGWFKTGDVVMRLPEGYKIVGRLSTDIIKVGGYKVSALEIEEVLRTHANILDCCVVGIPDPTWGERIAAAVVLQNPNKTITIDQLRDFCATQLANYKLPTILMATPNLPRNAMGKVLKPEVKTWFKW